MRKRNVFKVKTRLQNKLMLLVFISMFIPTLFFGGGLYYLISRVLQGGNDSGAIPLEGVIGLILFPGVFLFFIFIGFSLGLAYVITNRMVGPLDRLENDLEEILKGQKKGPLLVRPHDYLHPLVMKINHLLEKFTPES